MFSRPGSKKLPRVIKLCLRACCLKSVVQDWAFQIGFLSEMRLAVFLPVSAAPGFFLKYDISPVSVVRSFPTQISGRLFLPNPDDSDLANPGAHRPPLITNAHSTTHYLNTKFAKFTLRNGGPVKHQVSKRGPRMCFLCKSAASKNAAVRNPNLWFPNASPGFVCRTEISLVFQTGQQEIAGSD